MNKARRLLLLPSGFWMDVGQPKDFVIGSCMYLEHMSQVKPEMLCKNESCLGKLKLIFVLLCYCCRSGMLDKGYDERKSSPQFFRQCVGRFDSHDREELPDRP